MSNCPPTAFTLSFSKVVVDNVPRILAFSASIVPFPSVDILIPFNPLVKFFDSIIESVILNPPIVPPLNNTLEPVICPVEPVTWKESFADFSPFEAIVKPPIVPAVDFNTPAFVTLNSASANVASPNWIPTPGSNPI